MGANVPCNGEWGTYLKHAPSHGTAATNVSIVFSGIVHVKYNFFVWTLFLQMYRTFFTGNILKCPFLKVQLFDRRMSFKHTEHVFPVTIFSLGAYSKMKFRESYNCIIPMSHRFYEWSCAEKNIHLNSNNATEDGIVVQNICNPIEGIPIPSTSPMHNLRPLGWRYIVKKFTFHTMNVFIRTYKRLWSKIMNTQPQS